MKFSVIVPLYNLEGCIERCILSIINQIYRNYEIIIIDDGSSDRSGSICLEWADRDDRLKYFLTENRGPNVARNLGIEYSTGDYIIFLDGDDWVDEHLLQVLHNELQELSYDIVSFGFDFIDENGVEIERRSNDYKVLYDENIVISSLLVRDMASVCWNKCYSSRLFESGNLRFINDKKHGRDIIFTRSACSLARIARVIPIVLYHSFVRDSSFSRSFDHNNVSSGIEIANNIISMQKNEHSTALAGAVYYSAGKHLRYISTLSAIRSKDIGSHMCNIELLKTSGLWGYIYPSIHTISNYGRRDLITTFFACFPRLSWIASKALGLRGRTY